MIVGGVGNAVAEEDSPRDLNPGTAVIRGQPSGFGGRERAPFTMWLRRQESKM